MMLIFMNLSISLTSIFIFLTHPLSLGMILLIQTTLIALITGSMSFNYWFSYIIFLIMIGGMLILFIYMTSIASNEKFKFSTKLFILFFSLFFISSMLLMADFYFYHQISIIDLTLQTQQMNFKFSLNKFINWPNNLVFLMMIIYLLITLIMVVKITNINYGPLRQKN
uniref:NADH-ubiquinone oxidoreductase chain 6 n=1 Tax=Paraglenea fortunei TaxID=351083 RepID=A0A8F1BB63_9CUCU|nr:NADH dehydrogenase subunit 6 [Paraglenea fortunei]QWM97243.1 NADH dehydrogenase subunit 6 [Paraglenea fortunei]